MGKGLFTIKAFFRSNNTQIIIYPYYPNPLYDFTFLNYTLRPLIFQVKKISVRPDLT